MSNIVHLTRVFAVSRQLEPDDVATAARLGFRAIISLRPDGEDETSPTARRIGTCARKARLSFRHVPVAMHEVTEARAVDRFARALRGVEGPVLAYCKSGTRAALLWALASAEQVPLPMIAEALARAGVDAEIIEDELRDRQRQLQLPFGAAGTSAVETATA